MAEASLRAQLGHRGVEVGSAGLLSGGVPATELAIEVAAAHGYDLSRHVSRRMTAADVARADLVIGMTRDHVREAVTLVPDALGRGFTLKELVRRGRQSGSRLANEPLETWLARLASGRTLRDLLGHDTYDDIVDPIGESRSVYERVADEIDESVERLVEMAFAVPQPTQ